MHEFCFHRFYAFDNINGNSAGINLSIPFFRFEKIRRK